MFILVFSGLSLTATGHSTAGTRCFLAAGLFFAVLLLADLNNMLAAKLAQGPCRAGDYDRALALIRRFKFGLPSWYLEDMEGGVLALAGKDKEAEQCFRRSLAASPQRSKQHALTMVKLGFTLDDQDRPDEARQYFQTVVQLGDKTGSARIGLASIILDRDGDPQKALELIERTEAETHPRWTIRAKALARLGRRAEAEDAIAHALKDTKTDFKPTIAALHYEVGRAYLDLGETSEAVKHLQIACDTDRRGRCGRLAKEKLDKI